MTSKNLFWVRSKENNKRRIWVWIVSILLQLVSYPAVMTMYLSRIQFWNKEGAYQDNYQNLSAQSAYDKALYEAAADAVGFQPRVMWMILLLAVLIGIQGFSYLYDRRKVDLYHSVPVSAKSRYAVIYVNGILCYLLPNVVSLVTALGIAATQKAVNYSVLAECGYAFVMNLLFFLFLYHMTILAVMLTGNRVITGFVLFGLLFADYGVVWLYNGMESAFFETADRFFTSFTPHLSPIHDYNSNIYNLKQATDLGKIGATLVPLYLKWAVLAVICGILAYVCYQRRKSETAGKAIAFEKVKPVLKIAVAVLTGVAVCYLVYESVYYNMWITVLAMIGGTLLCCGVMEVIYEFDIRAALKHLASTGISVAVVVIIFAIYQFDILGYDSYIPEPEEVESMAISTVSYYQDYFNTEDGYEYFGDAEYYRQNMFLTSVEAVCELAAKAQNTDRASMKEEQEMKVLYRLKSGREVSRTFCVDFADASNEPLLNQIFGSEEYIAGVYQFAEADKELDNQTLEVSYSNGTIEKNLSYLDARALQAAWLEDMKQFDFSLARHNRICGQIELFFTDYYNVWTLPVYDTFENTIAYLQEKDAYYPQKVNPEDVTDIIVTNYHSEEEDVALDEDRSVTETFTEPDEIAEIAAHIYPNSLDMTWNPEDETIGGYEVMVNYKTGKDYPYGAAYYYYQFIKDEVPEFVDEATALPEE